MADCPECIYAATRPEGKVVTPADRVAVLNADGTTTLWHFACYAAKDQRNKAK